MAAIDRNFSLKIIINVDNFFFYAKRKVRDWCTI